MSILLEPPRHVILYISIELHNAMYNTLIVDLLRNRILLNKAVKLLILFLILCKFSNYFKLKSIVIPKCLNDRTILIGVQLQYVVQVPKLCIIKL
jgi:hypothetical protein